MSNFLYVEMCGECINDSDETKFFNVIIRFKNQEEFDIESGELFDCCNQTFSKGIPKGWQIDDGIEPCRNVSEKEAIEKGFQIFVSDSEWKPGNETPETWTNRLNDVLNEYHPSVLSD